MLNKFNKLLEHDFLSKNRLVIIVLLIQQTVSALVYPVAKAGLKTIEPFVFAFYRFVLSSVALLIMVSIKKHKNKIIKSDKIKIVGLGLLIIPFNQLAYLYGQKLTAAGHGALLFATTPIWIFVGALIFLKEKFNIYRTFGIILGVVGIVVILVNGALKIGKEYIVGDMIIMVAVIVWAAYTLIGKSLVTKYGAIRVTAYALSSGTLVYFPFGLWRAIKFNYSATPISAWVSVFYVAFGISVVSYTLWYWVLKHMEASRIAVFHNFQPLLATAVAAIFLNEAIGLAFIIGGIMVLIGVTITEKNL